MWGLEGKFAFTYVFITIHLLLLSKNFSDNWYGWDITYIFIYSLKDNLENINQAH